MNNTLPIIQCTHLSKSYAEAGHTVEVLKDLNLAIHPGEGVAIVGASGSGKSTLLHLMGGLDKPSNGQVLVSGVDIHTLSERQKSLWRNQNLGFVYQFHHLLPEFDAVENVCMPLLIRKSPTQQAIEKAKHLLDQVGLGNRYQHRVSELSGGERQRVAIARALVTDPGCVLADEPTGNLDNKTARQVIELILHLNQTLKISLVIVTHDLALASQMGRTLSLEEGVLCQ